MATHAVQPAGAVARSYEHTERHVYAIFMIVAPLILLAATIIHPPHGIRATSGKSYYDAAYDHTTRFYIAHTLFFFTGVTLIVAFIGLNRLVRRTHPKAAFWGLVLGPWGSWAGVRSTAWTS
jgi:hypothetical protein